MKEGRGVDIADAVAVEDEDKEATGNVGDVVTGGGRSRGGTRKTRSGGRSTDGLEVPVDDSKGGRVSDNAKAPEGGS